MTILRAYALRLLFFVGLGFSAANAGQSAESLIQAGINKVCAKFAEIVSAAEGNFTTVNQFGCLGAFQFCPGTFELYYSGTADQFLHDPVGQVAAWTKFEETQWKLVLKNDLTQLKGKVADLNGKTVTIDESAILMGCSIRLRQRRQAGELYGGWRLQRPRRQGRQRRESVCAYLIKGAGQEVSCFTGVTGPGPGPGAISNISASSITSSGATVN